MVYTELLLTHTRHSTSSRSSSTTPSKPDYRVCTLLFPDDKILQLAAAAASSLPRFNHPLCFLVQERPALHEIEPGEVGEETADVGCSGRVGVVLVVEGENWNDFLGYVVHADEEEGA